MKSGDRLLMHLRAIDLFNHLLIPWEPGRYELLGMVLYLHSDTAHPILKVEG